MARRLISLALVATLAGCASIASSDIPVPVQSTVTPASPRPTPTPSPTFDSSVFSNDDPDSIWIVADKLRPLDPLNYVPDDLVALDLPHRFDPRIRSGAAGAYVALFAAAKKDGIDLVIQSAYRSYDLQVAVYNGYVRSRGQKQADLQSARPGHSEHQTGLSLDLAAKNGRCTIAVCFGETPEGQWLVDHAWEFGWVLRYPKGLTHITGYMYEPWHWRYVGRGLAAELHKTPNITLEEFFDLPPAPDYAN